MEAEETWSKGPSAHKLLDKKVQNGRIGKNGDEWFVRFYKM